MTLEIKTIGLMVVASSCVEDVKKLKIPPSISLQRRRNLLSWASLMVGCGEGALW